MCICACKRVCVLGVCVCVHEYLEGGQVQQGEAVEEADALQGHLDDPGGVGLLGAVGGLAGGVGQVAVQQDAVEAVHHADELRVLQQGCQPRPVLALVVEDAGGAGRGYSGVG